MWACIINNITNSKIQNNVKFKYAITSMNNISTIIGISIVVMLILAMI